VLKALDHLAASDADALDVTAEALRSYVLDILGRTRDGLGEGRVHELVPRRANRSRDAALAGLGDVLR